MKCLVKFMVLPLLVASVAVGNAQEKRWSDQAELSFVDSGGNTEVTVLAATNSLTYHFGERTLGTWDLGILFSENDGVKNAESYFTEIRVDHIYTEQLYSFAGVGWKRNKFAGIDSRSDLGAGAGYKLLTGPFHHLLGEAGVTYTLEEYTDNTDRNYLGGRLFGEYWYALSEKNTLSQALELLLDFGEVENWILTSETALTMALSDALAFKAAYTVIRDNEPVVGLEKTDTLLGVSLIVNY